jgi:hypothetical protein
VFRVVVTSGGLMRITTVGRSMVGTVGGVVALAMAISLVAGCLNDDATDSATATAPVVETVLPSALVGAWGLEGAGLPVGSVLRIARDGTGLSISRPGGTCFPSGSWRASIGGLFIGQIPGGSGECWKAAEGFPDFLQQVRGFGRVGGDLVLTAADGSVVVRLVPGATPMPNPYAPPASSSIPVLTEATRVALDAPAKTLTGTTPATPARIEGSWRPESQKNPRSSLRFTGATGSWSGFDGCNGYGGTWALAAAGGSFLVLGLPSDAIGCNNDDTGSFQRGVYAGFEGAVLVFGDKNGKVVGRFVRAPSTPTP